VSADPKRQHRHLSAPVIVAFAGSGGEGVANYFAPLVQRREIGAIAPVRGQPFSVLVTQSEAEGYAAMTRFRRGLLAGLVLLTVGGAGVFAYAIKGYGVYERRLETSNALFTAVTEGTNDAVFVKDRDGRYLLINAAGARFVGRPVADVVGRSDFELFDATTARRIRTTDRSVIESGELTAQELPSPDPFGVEHLFSTVRAPYRDARGNIVGVIGVARDITREHEAEQTNRRQAIELSNANTLLAAVVEGTTDIVFVKDLEERYLLMNAAGAKVFGVSRDDVIGRRIDEIQPASVADDVRARDREVMSAGITMTGETLIRVAGVEHTLSSVVAPWRNALGVVVGLIGISRDITEQERTRNALAISEKRHRDLFAMSKGLICVHDMAGVLVTVNPAAAELLGYSPEEMTGTALASYVPPEHAAKFQKYLDGFATSDEHEGLLILCAKSGEQRVLQFSNRVYVEDGRRHVIGHAQDVTERRRYEQRLRELSFSDPLTGLFNRRYLSQRETDAAPGARFGVIAVDLDHFKQINDTHGHQRGDEVLIAVGRFLKRHARSHDVVVRMGGDEFLLLLPDADAAATEALAERIKSDGANAPCGLSIGHAVRVGDEALEQTINRADLTLYRIRIEMRGYDRRKHSSDEDASRGTPQ